ncbi:MAG: response regulator transcription factor, partial [Acidobacteriota bacterium]|nr:response regulator transcription factor [Acidobacteriota bacterium]
MQEGATRVLIAGPRRLEREGLVALFSRSEGFVVVGEADDGETAIERVMRLRPDVAVLDVSLPRVDGIEATRRLTGTTVPTRVVVLTTGEGLEDDARKAGAYDLLRAELTSFDDLAEVVRRAARRDRPGDG